MYPVNFTEKMSVNLTHAHTVCTRPSLSQREGPGDEANFSYDGYTVVANSTVQIA